MFEESKNVVVRRITAFEKEIFNTNYSDYTNQYSNELEVDPIREGFDKYFKQKENILSNLLNNCFGKKEDF